MNKDEEYETGIVEKIGIIGAIWLIYATAIVMTLTLYIILTK